jgi:hypothetical protein
MPCETASRNDRRAVLGEAADQGLLVHLGD